MFARLVACIGIMVVALSAPILKAVQVGDKPSLSFTALDGKQIDLKDYRGKLLIVDFCNPNVDAARDEEFHIVELARKHTDDGVAVIGVWYDRDLPRAQALLKETGVTWPVWLDGKTDSLNAIVQWNHRGIGPVLLGPDGTVLWTGYYAALDKQLDDALVSNPPTIIDPDELAKANASLDAADKSFAANDDTAGLKSLSEIPADATKNKLFTLRLDSMQPRIKQAIASKLAPIDDLIAQHQNLAAVNQLKELQKSLKGSPAESEINNRLVALQADRQTLAQSQQADNEQKASAALAQARKLRDDQKLADAYLQLKDIVTDYPSTASAATAADMVKSFEQDPDMMKQVHEQIVDTKANGILALARSYVSAGLNTKAREKFQSVIDQFPDSAQANTAKKEMDALN